MTQQINRAYALILASHFQGFCRDLHSEAVEHLIAPISLATLRDLARNALVVGRKLDRGNANRSNIGADFSRLGLKLSQIETMEWRNETRLEKLDTLGHWRNAIAHQDFSSAELGGATTLRLRIVKSWRIACEQLARSFDAAVRDRITAVVGTPPW
jgi:hypothetical protein